MTSCAILINRERRQNWHICQNQTDETTLGRGDDRETGGCCLWKHSYIYGSCGPLPSNQPTAGWFFLAHPKVDRSLYILWWWCWLRRHHGMCYEVKKTNFVRIAIGDTHTGHEAHDYCILAYVSDNLYNVIMEAMLKTTLDPYQKETRTRGYMN